MSPSLAVILLNYKRPQNLGAIAAAARQALPQAPIFILDQGARDDFHERADVPWADVWLRRARVNGGAGARVLLASRLPFDLYIAIDDDTFLRPAQIGALAQHLRSEPDRAHGVWGERLVLREGVIQLRTSITRVNAPLSNLNQVYAFSRGQASAAIDLAARAGFATWRDVGMGDDILLSCASSKLPLCHDLGGFDMCVTSGQPGIATWRNVDFRGTRARLVRKLLALEKIAVFPPADPPSAADNPLA